jgi:enoyl-CoA hydratase/carnithine racemase
VTATTRQLVTTERDNACAVVTLNRPEKLNAMNAALLEQLLVALDTLRGEARVVILTGAGNRAFSVGNDLTEAAAAPARHFAGRYGGPLYRVLEEIRGHSAVVVAAVNGYALGGGVGLVASCDLAIASRRAQFGIPQVGFGAFPGAGAPTVRSVLPKHAAYAVLTASRFDALTARRWGLVNEIVEPGRLQARALQLASLLVARDSGVLADAKRALRATNTF